MGMTEESQPEGETCQSAFGAKLGLSFQAANGGFASNPGLIAAVVLGALALVGLLTGLAYRFRSKVGCSCPSLGCSCPSKVKTKSRKNQSKPLNDTSPM